MEVEKPLTKKGLDVNDFKLSAHPDLKSFVIETPSLRVQSKRSLEHDQLGSIRAHPGWNLTETEGILYFEVLVDNISENGVLGIGVISLQHPLVQILPGWTRGSYGYRADDGFICRGNEGTSKLFKKLDISKVPFNLGFGIKLATKEAFLTHNGDMIGRMFYIRKEDEMLFPAIGVQGDITAQFLLKSEQWKFKLPKEKKLLKGFSPWIVHKWKNGKDQTDENQFTMINNENDESIIQVEQGFFCAKREEHFYFEVTVKCGSDKSTVSVGLTRPDHPIPSYAIGLVEGGYGYHSDDGKVMANEVTQKVDDLYKPYGKEETTIGVILEPINGQLYFTRDGELLGLAATLPRRERFVTLYPAISVSGKAVIKINMGTEDFKCRDVASMMQLKRQDVISSSAIEVNKDNSIYRMKYEKTDESYASEFGALFQKSCAEIFEPQGELVFYCEMKIESVEDPSTFFGLGLAEETFELEGQFPGWDSESYAYHGDDGTIWYRGKWKSYRYPTYSQGDTVGMGLLKHGRKEGLLFYTLNGRLLQPAPLIITKLANRIKNLYVVVGAAGNNVGNVSVYFNNFKFDISNVPTAHDLLRFNIESKGDPLADQSYDISDMFIKRNYFVIRHASQKDAVIIKRMSQSTSLSDKEHFNQPHLVQESSSVVCCELLQVLDETGKRTFLFTGTSDGCVNFHSHEDDKWTFTGQFDNAPYGVYPTSIRAIDKPGKDNHLKVFVVYSDYSVRVLSLKNTRGSYRLTDEQGYHVTGAHDAPISTVLRWVSKFITISNDKTAKVWDVNSSKEELTLKHDFPVTYGRMVWEKNLLITGCTDGTVCLWDLTSKRPKTLYKRHIHRGEVTSITYFNKLDTIYTGASDGSIYKIKIPKGLDTVWEDSVVNASSKPALGASGRGSFYYDKAGAITSMEVLCNGAFLITATAAEELQLWSTGDGKRYHTYNLEKQNGKVNYFHPHPKYPHHFFCAHGNKILHFELKGYGFNLISTIVEGEVKKLGWKPIPCDPVIKTQEEFLYAYSKYCSEDELFQATMKMDLSFELMLRQTEWSDYKRVQTFTQPLTIDYDLLLEKIKSNDPQEIKRLYKLAEKHRNFMIKPAEILFAAAKVGSNKILKYLLQLNLIPDLNTIVEGRRAVDFLLEDLPALDHITNNLEIVRLLIVRKEFGINLITSEVERRTPLQKLLENAQMSEAYNDWDEQILDNKIEYLKCAVEFARVANQKQSKRVNFLARDGSKQYTPYDLALLIHINASKALQYPRDEYDYQELIQKEKEYFTLSLELLDYCMKDPDVEDSRKGFSLKQFWENLSIYAIFLLLLTIVAVFRTEATSRMFLYHRDIENLFVHQPFGNDITFEEISNVEDVYEWLQGPLIRGLYQTDWQSSLNQPLFVTTQPGYVSGFNKIIGSARVRQIRVKTTSCGNTLTETAYCVPEFFLGSREDKDPYGSNGITFEWKQAESDSIFFGKFSDPYPSSGFYVDLHSNLSVAQQSISDLQDGEWIDTKTRLIHVSFSIYNPNLNLVAFIQHAIEFPSSGGLVPYTRFYIVEPINAILLIMEVIIALYICYEFIYQEIYEMGKAIKRNQFIRKYVHDIWNLYEILIIAIFIAIVVLRVLISLESPNYDAVDRYVDLSRWGSTITQERFLIGFLTVLCWLRLLKFLKIPHWSGKVVTTFLTTLSSDSVTLFLFILVFVLLSFSVAFHVGFATAEAFSSFGSAFMSVIRLILGEFEQLDELSQKDVIWARIMFVFVVSFGGVILLNLLIAILTENYTKSQEFHEAMYERLITKLMYKELKNRDKPAQRITRYLFIRIVRFINFIKRIWNGLVRGRDKSSRSRRVSRADIELQVLEPTSKSQTIPENISHASEYSEKEDSTYKLDEKQVADFEDECRKSRVEKTSLELFQEMQKINTVLVENMSKLSTQISKLQMDMSYLQHEVRELKQKDQTSTPKPL